MTVLIGGQWLELGHEVAVGAVAFERRLAGEAAAGLGEEVENLAAIDRAARDALGQRGRTRQVAAQGLPPIDQAWRAGGLLQDDRVTAAVEPEEGAHRSTQFARR